MFGSRGLRTRNMFEEMDRFARQLHEVLDHPRAVQYEMGTVFPPLNVYDDGESFVVRAEVPGIDPSKLEVQATADSLTIKGERSKQRAPEGVSWHRRERDHGVFNRSLNLPQAVNPDKITAKYEFGVLELILPRAEESKPRRISID